MFFSDAHLKATKLALLQSKFHRTIKRRTTLALRPFQLKSVDWIILGLLNHKKRPMAITEIASQVGTSQPFMTTIMNKLVKRNLIVIADDKDDHRKRYVKLTKDGRRVITLTQRQFFLAFAPLVRGLSEKDLEVHMKILTTVLANAKADSSLK